MGFKKGLALVGVGLFLAGCEMYGPIEHNMSGFDWGDPRPLQTLSAKERVGSPFTKALADGYQRLAEREGAATDQQRWARKGLLAAEGTLVHPELPETWDLRPYGQTILRPGGEPYKDLYEVREDMLETFYQCGMRQKEPQVAAHAQVSFDCLVEGMERNPADGLLQTCHDTFETTLFKLKMACGNTETGFVVLFEFGSDKLTPEARALVTGIARAAQGGKPVSLMGWSDTVGSPIANMALAARRIAAVKAALLHNGVSPDQITETAQGNANLPVTTGPNVRNQANRSVYIGVGT